MRRRGGAVWGRLRVSSAAPGPALVRARGDGRPGRNDHDVACRAVGARVRSPADPRTAHPGYDTRVRSDRTPGCRGSHPVPPGRTGVGHGVRSIRAVGSPRKERWGATTSTAGRPWSSARDLWLEAFHFPPA